MIKDKIIFFTNGDFAIDTLEEMCRYGFNVVGVVTSNEKVKYHSVNAFDIAKRNGIPTYVIKNGVPMEKDEFFIDWLKRLNADIFCVISFKKLHSDILKLAKKCAFNVHASLLPALPGAAPINWAIRLGLKETGLTAFVLNDKIDGGDIIANVKVPISENDTFKTLFSKLSTECVYFTTNVIGKYLTKEDWKDYTIAQPSFSDGYEYIVPATKVNEEYFDSIFWRGLPANEFKNAVNSVDDGWPCKITAMHKTDPSKDKEFDIKVYEIEDGAYEETPDVDVLWATESDGKTYIKVNIMYDTYFYIKKLQLSGKKIMDVPTFLNGFRYFRDENYRVCIAGINEEKTELITKKD